MRYVQNVTDIDDDILRKAAEVSVDWRALRQSLLTSHFIRDMQVLNVRPPDGIPAPLTSSLTSSSAVGALIERGLRTCRAALPTTTSMLAPPSAGWFSSAPTEMPDVANERGNWPNDPHKRIP